MTARRSPILQRIYEMAHEGRYTRHEIVLAAADLVPNGQASRVTLRRRAASARQQGYQSNKHGADARHDPDVTGPGRRRVASEAWMQAKRKGRIIEDENGIVTLDPNVQL